MPRLAKRKLILLLRNGAKPKLAKGGVELIEVIELPKLVQCFVRTLGFIEDLKMVGMERFELSTS